MHLPTRNVQNKIQFHEIEQGAKLHRDATISLHNATASIARHWFSCALCLFIFVAIGLVYTKYSTPVYDAGSVIRFQSERVDVPQLVQILYSDNGIGTEMEVLRGRAAATAVIDSLGLRMELLTPRRVPITNIFSSIRVDPGADTITLHFVLATGKTFDVYNGKSSALIAQARVGEATSFGGISFVLRENATRQKDFAARVILLDDAVQQFRNSLEVSRPARDADLISIHARSSDPLRAATIANVLARNVLSSRATARRGSTGSALTFLQQQDDSLSKQLKTAEDSLRLYQQREHVIDVPVQAEAEVSRLAKLQADLAGIRAERDAFALLVKQLRSDSLSGIINGESASRRLMAFPTLLSNPAASTLLGALAQVESERAQLLIRRMPGDSDVQIFTNRIREIERQLQDIAETFLQSLSFQVASLSRKRRRFAAN